MSGRARRVALAVALAVLLAGTAGGAPVSAADLTATKGFLRDCTLTMQSEDLGSVFQFVVSDAGDDCGDYYLRSASIQGGDGRLVATAAWSDQDPDYEREELALAMEEPFISGNVNVYVPYKQRCHRYQLTAEGDLRFLDSRPCSGPGHPPAQKRFEQDCTLSFLATGYRGGYVSFRALDFGPDCGEYQLRGISMVTTDGRKVAAGASTGDEADDPDLEDIAVGEQGDFAYGQVNVYIPFKDRCHRYRFGGGYDIRIVASTPCGPS